MINESVRKTFSTLKPRIWFVPCKEEPDDVLRESHVLSCKCLKCACCEESEELLIVDVVGFRWLLYTVRACHASVSWFSMLLTFASIWLIVTLWQPLGMPALQDCEGTLIIDIVGCRCLPDIVGGGYHVCARLGDAYARTSTSRSGENPLFLQILKVGAAAEGKEVELRVEQGKGILVGVVRLPIDGMRMYAQPKVVDSFHENLSIHHYGHPVNLATPFVN